jgi:hypothetical protein
LRYNFQPNASSSIGSKRSKHSAEHIAKIRDAMSISVSVYDLDNVLVETFASQKLAADWLNISRPAVSKAIKLGHIVNGKFIIQKTGSHS